MRLINGAESREMDRLAMEEYHLDTMVLMENAGLRAADFCADILQELNAEDDSIIAVVCGRGNNGGDGLVMARHLYNKGYRVEIFFTGDEEEFSPAEKANYDIAKAMDIPMDFLTGARDLTLFRLKLMSSAIIVDAVFGCGFKGEIAGLAKDVAELINEVRRPVLSLDIPSGINADTGECGTTFVQADYTLSFALPKFGNILAPGGEHNGQLSVADISFPRALTVDADGDAFLVDRSMILSAMPKREKDTHKGNFGHVLVCGGSANMSGSLLLAGEGALKSGAGLVTYLMPECLLNTVRNHNIEAMTCCLPQQQDGSLGEAAADVILQQTGNKILVMGMGLSRSAGSMALARKIVEEVNCPLVLDADGLWVLGDVEGRRNTRQPLIMTPHPGEMAHILGCSIKDVQANRIDAALACARRFTAVTVLKGSRSIIATPEGKIYVNVTGNAGMSTGGSGDVLSGIIGSMLGQGLSPVEAAVCGVYIHGLAGDYAAGELGQLSMTASNIIDFLPQVLSEMELN